MNTEKQFHGGVDVAALRQALGSSCGLHLVRPSASDSRGVSASGMGILASRSEVLAVVGKLNPSGLCFADTADELAMRFNPEVFHEA